MKINLFSFCLVLFLSFQALGNSIPYDAHDLAVYQTGIKLCTGYSFKDPWRIAGRSVRDTLKGKLLSLNTDLDQMIGNPWFDLALTDCFGYSTTKKMWFVTYLMSFDLIPKALMVGAGLKALPVVGETFSYIKATSPLAYAVIQTYIWYPPIKALIDEVRRSRKPHRELTTEEIDQALRDADAPYREAMLRNIDLTIEGLKNQIKMSQSMEEQSQLNQKIKELEELKLQLIAL